MLTVTIRVFRFDTGVGGLVLEDQFLQLSTRLCSENVYGLGETVHSTFKRNLWYDTYPLFGRDQPTIADDDFVVCCLYFLVLLFVFSVVIVCSGFLLKCLLIHLCPHLISSDSFLNIIALQMCYF